MSPQESSDTPTDETPLLKKARAVVEKLKEAGYEAYFAGGCVRDLVMKKEPKDYDIATSATPEEVISLFRKTVDIGAKFGVIQVRHQGEGFEVATFRSDTSYSDGRRPDAITFVTAREDVERRDFTINGLLFDPETEEIIDHVGGQADINAASIRAIGDPTARFEEDRLRMLRAIRFSARLNFEIDSETLNAIIDQADAIQDVSPERIRDEIWRILSEGGAHRGLPLLKKCGLLTQILPEFCEDKNPPLEAICTLLAEMPPGDPISSLALLLYPAPGAIARDLGDRLRMSTTERQRLEALLEGLNEGEIVSPDDLPRYKRFLGQAEANTLVRLLEGLAEIGLVRKEQSEKIRVDLSGFSDEELHPKPLLDGTDLQELGYAPGPRFKTALNALEDAQLAGTVTNREEAEALVRNILDSP